MRAGRGLRRPGESFRSAGARRANLYAAFAPGRGIRSFASAAGLQTAFKRDVVFDAGNVPHFEERFREHFGIVGIPSCEAVEPQEGVECPGLFG